jgi:hypothetical protein
MAGQSGSEGLFAIDEVVHLAHDAVGAAFANHGKETDTEHACDQQCALRQCLRNNLFFFFIESIDSQGRNLTAIGDWASNVSNERQKRYVALVLSRHVKLRPYLSC